MNTDTNLGLYAEGSYAQSNGIHTDELEIVVDGEPIAENTQRIVCNRNTAKDIYERGEAFDYIVESCSHFHVGDLNIIKCMILSHASSYIGSYCNSKGIHISISGSAGSGKSHVVEQVLRHMPNSKCAGRRYSPKSLYYASAQKIIPEQSIIVMDDQELDQELQDSIKEATTKWDEPYEYVTVNKQLQAQVLTMPLKATYWIIKANLEGDEQVLDRQLILHVDESREQKQRIHNYIQESFTKPSNTIVDTQTIEISKLIWDYIPTGTNVFIPYSKDILLPLGMGDRDKNLFYYMIQSLAILRAPIRKHLDDGSIEASIEDLNDVIFIMNGLLNNEGGSQGLKLSPDGNMIMSKLQEIESGAYSYSEIATMLGISNDRVGKAVRGRNHTNSDSLERIKGISLEEGVGKRKLIVWNKEAFKNGYSDLKIFMEKDKIQYWSAYFRTSSTDSTKED